MYFVGLKEPKGMKGRMKGCVNTPYAWTHNALMWPRRQMAKPKSRRPAPEAHPERPFSSVGMQIGGIGELAPERRGDLARLGLKTLLCGTLASYMSATLAGP
jgi:hypothetical protein